jgi:catechol 2,3-dioxygenase-like lactoylglutathione lyase family enzyme
MTGPRTPQVAREQHHTSLRVADLSAAIELYTTRLGSRTHSRGVIHRRWLA